MLLNVAAHRKKVEWIRNNEELVVPARQPQERLPLGEHQVHHCPRDLRGRSRTRVRGSPSTSTGSGPSTRAATLRTACAIRRSTSGGSCSSATSTGSPRSARREPHAVRTDGDVRQGRGRRWVARGPDGSAGPARCGGSTSPSTNARAIVFEQRGAGIGFLPDSARYLVERAKVDLDAISISTERIRYLARGWHRYARHRAGRTGSARGTRSTVRCLVSFGHDRYLLGHEATGLTPATDHVVVHFAEHAAETVNLLVCADGIGSGFRSQLIPEADRGTPATWHGAAWCQSRGSSRPIVAALRDAITYHVFAQQPHPRVSDPGTRRIGRAWPPALQLRLVSQLPGGG